MRSIVDVMRDLTSEPVGNIVMPYLELVKQLRTKLDRERNVEKRGELETSIAVLLGLIEIMEKTDKLANQLMDHIRDTQ